MPNSTTNLSFQLPIVGSDANAWGGYLNANWTALDALLWGSATIRPDLAAGLWEIGGVAVTSTAAELNKLASSTASAVEINYLTGVTSAIQTQLNARQPLDDDLTAIAGVATAGLVARTGAGTAAARTITGTANQITVTDGDGAAGNPTIAASVASEAEAQAGADTTKLMTSQRTAQAINYMRRVYQVEDRKTSGTAGGGSTAATWVTRDLNTEAVDRIDGAALATNVVTLPIGRYRVTGWAVSYRAGLHRARLYNVTGAAESLRGSSANSTASSDTSPTLSLIEGEITLGVETQMRLEHWANGTRATDGFGQAVSDGGSEVYSMLRFEWLGA